MIQEEDTIKKWLKPNVPTNEVELFGFMSTPQIAFAWGKYGVVWQTTDLTNWSVSFKLPGKQHLWAGSFINDNEAVIVGTNVVLQWKGGVWKVINQTAGDLRELVYDETYKELVALDYMSGLSWSKDFGKTWTEIYPNKIVNARGLCLDSNKSIAYCGMKSGVVYAYDLFAGTMETKSVGTPTGNMCGMTDAAGNVYFAGKEIRRNGNVVYVVPDNPNDPDGNEANILAAKYIPLIGMAMCGEEGGCVTSKDGLTWKNYTNFYTKGALTALGTFKNNLVCVGCKIDGQLLSPIVYQSLSTIFGSVPPLPPLPPNPGWKAIVMNELAKIDASSALIKSTIASV